MSSFITNMFKILTNYFKDLISVCGEQSSARFGFLFAILISNFSVWITWIVFCIVKGEIVDIPAGVYTALAISSGVAFTGKVAQSYIEKPIKEEKNIKNET